MSEQPDGLEKLADIGNILNNDNKKIVNQEWLQKNFPGISKIFNANPVDQMMDMATQVPGIKKEVGYDMVSEKSASADPDKNRLSGDPDKPGRSMWG